MPCPHFKISIVKRSQGQSAVAGAAYQSGERLFSEYDQKTKFYNKRKELVHAEIMLPPNAPPGYADRATLWNAVEAVENQWNSQLARRIVLALPKEVPKDQYVPMLNPGEGKTYFAMHLAAACTNGKLLPNMERMEPFNVIYQTAEDGLGDTVKPRLIEAGADLDRVLVIDDSDVQLTLSDERIEKAIIENNARLVIIDPIQAYLGADVDMNRANEVRPIFMRLGQVAQRTGCAILLIGHLNKAAGMQSLQRGLGSIDIAAAVRSVMFIGKLKHDPTMRILTHEKSSLAPPGASLAFSLGDEGGFRWVGEYDITADEMLSGIEPQRETKTQQAKDLICTLLAGGKQVLSEDIDKAALERGIPGRTVRDAKRELGDALKSKIVEGRKKVFWME